MKRAAWTVTALGSLLSAGCLLLSGHDGNFACKSDSDCNDDEKCLATDYGTCVPLDACHSPGSSSECRNGKICDGKTCRTHHCDSANYLVCNGYACTDAYECKTTCVADSDCAPDAACISHVCKRGLCSGTPTDCATITSTDDCVKGGCHWAGPCAGDAKACDAVPPSQICETQLGCSLDSYGYCRGTAVTCADLGVTTDCSRQLGCYATTTGSCTGTLSPCSAYTAHWPCVAVAGCSWN